MQQIKIRFVAVMLITLAVLAACGSQGSINYTTYATESGVSFVYPEGWVIDASSPDEISFASSQEILDSGSIATGAAGTIFVSSPEFFGDDLAATLDALVKLMTEGEETGIRVVEPARAVTINGQEGMRVKLAGDDQGVGVTLTATLLEQANRLVFVMLIFDNTTTADMAPIMTHIENSIAFGQ